MDYPAKLAIMFFPTRGTKVSTSTAQTKPSVQAVNNSQQSKSLTNFRSHDIPLDLWGFFRTIQNHTGIKEADFQGHHKVDDLYKLLYRKGNLDEDEVNLLEPTLAFVSTDKEYKVQWRKETVNEALNLEARSFSERPYGQGLLNKKFVTASKKAVYQALLTVAPILAQVSDREVVVLERSSKRNTYKFQRSFQAKKSQLNSREKQYSPIFLGLSSRKSDTNPEHTALEYLEPINEYIFPKPQQQPSRQTVTNEPATPKELIGTDSTHHSLRQRQLQTQAPEALEPQEDTNDGEDTKPAARVDTWPTIGRRRVSFDDFVTVHGDETQLKKINSDDQNTRGKATPSGYKNQNLRKIVARGHKETSIDVYNFKHDLEQQTREYLARYGDVTDLKIAEFLLSNKESYLYITKLLSAGDDKIPTINAVAESISWRLSSKGMDAKPHSFPEINTLFEQQGRPVSSERVIQFFESLAYLSIYGDSQSQEQLNKYFTNGITPGDGSIVRQELLNHFFTQRIAPGRTSIGKQELLDEDPREIQVSIDPETEIKTPVIRDLSDIDDNLQRIISEGYQGMNDEVRQDIQDFDHALRIEANNYLRTQGNEIEYRIALALFENPGNIYKLVVAGEDKMVAVNAIAQWIRDHLSKSGENITIDDVIVFFERLAGAGVDWKDESPEELINRYFSSKFQQNPTSIRRAELEESESLVRTGD